MPDGPTTGRLFEKIEDVRVEQSRVAEALEGVVKHLATLNGSVAKQEGRIQILEGKESERKGANALMQKFAPVVYAALIALSGLLFSMVLLNADKLMAIRK